MQNGYQVFDIREETAKSRECVLVWDGEREVSSFFLGFIPSSTLPWCALAADDQCYVLHALPTTWHLTQNRTLSAQRSEGPFARPPSPPPAVPAKRKPAQTGALPSAATVDVPKRAKKAAKPKKAAAPKAPPAPKPAAAPKLPTTKKAAAPKKAPAKKAAAKGKQATPSKVKSAEYIEDSSPEPEPTSEMQDDGGMDDMDEFEDMLGKAMEEEGEEDEEEEFEEDEDDELGGAQLGAGGYGNDDVEYI